MHVADLTYASEIHALFLLAFLQGCEYNCCTTQLQNACISKIERGSWHTHALGLLYLRNACARMIIVSSALIKQATPKCRLSIINCAFQMRRDTAWTPGPGLMRF